MLSAASRRATGSRAIQTRRASISLCEVCRQRRQFRFGPWGSRNRDWDEDREAFREARKQNRELRYRYMESLHRRLWDDLPKSAGHSEGGKKAPADAVASENKVDDKNTIADTDRGAASWFETLPRKTNRVQNKSCDGLRQASEEQGTHEFEMWKTPLKSIRGYLSTHRSPKEINPDPVLDTTTSFDGNDTTIDPITNRRVTKMASKPTKASFTPKFEDVDQQPNLQSTSAGRRNSQRYGAARWDDPDGLPTKGAEEESKQYKDLSRYQTSQLDETEGLQRKSPEEISKAYPDLDKYGPVRWQEPDGLQEARQEEITKQPNDLGQYGTMKWNEPDGLLKPTAEELTKIYEDLGSYAANKFNEPDGLRQLTPEEESKKYQDLAAYDGPRTARDSALAEHEAAQNNTTIKGNTLPPRVEVTSENPGTEYKDLDAYKPVYWNEPDGLRKLTPEEESKKYDDLNSYGAVRWNEPGGLPQSTREETSKQYKDLREYTPEDFDSVEHAPMRLHPEEASKQHQDLDSYRPVKWNEPDGLQKVTAEEESKFYTDLSKYTQDGIPEMSSRIHPGEGSKVHDDLEMYGSVAHGAGQTKNVRSDNPTKHNNDSNDLQTEGSSTSASNSGLESLSAEEIRANVLRRAHESSQKQEGRDTTATKLTGNYVRDFPEEFTTSWSTLNSGSKSTLFPSNMISENQGKEDVGRDEAEARSMDESFPSEEPRLEPALNRHARKKSRSDAGETKQDPYSTAAQGLQTSYREEVGAATMPPIAKHYGSYDSAAPSTPCRGESKLWHYKILAYDPPNDSVRMVQTTSAVQDTSRPQTPGDIIPRLTNPARFLSYFGMLETQGYELISGSHNTLVFRKVREATAGSEPTVEQAPPGPRINPIDMMGKPVTGNFASPTGFVNYDSIPEEKVNKPAPPFRSHADVHRQESAPSDVKTSDQAPNKKKNTLARNLVIGTAWAGGTACALGVVGEYFASRGAPPRPGVAPDHGRARE